MLILLLFITDTQFPYLEAMIRDDILKIKLDKETFKKFRRAYKDCKAEVRFYFHQGFAVVCPMSKGDVQNRF